MTVELFEQLVNAYSDYFIAQNRRSRQRFKLVGKVTQLRFKLEEDWEDDHLMGERLHIVAQGMGSTIADYEEPRRVPDNIR